jgi:hypothetical protein
MLQGGAAGVGQFDPARSADEEWLAEFLFEVEDLLAEGGLSDGAGGGGAGEGTVIDDGAEVSELA